MIHAEMQPPLLPSTLGFNEALINVFVEIY